jgi:hypothetical protein
MYATVEGVRLLIAQILVALMPHGASPLMVVGAEMSGVVSHDA